MARPTPTLAQQIDHAAERNAALIVRLQKTIARLHQVGPDHRQASRWWSCPHPECQYVQDLLSASKGNLS